MTINWQKEVEMRKDDLLNDLFTLLRIRSVREDDKATKDAPVGPGPKEALLKMLEIGKKDGFVTKNIENIAGHIEYGTGTETLGIFGHMDVVPEGDGWVSDPYVPEIRDHKIYARGTSDDKGPSIAAYYALKIIKELKLPLSKRIRFIVGSDEESGWMDMERYFANEEKPDFGFSPDAEFPIINGEKGNVTLTVHVKGENNGCAQLKSFHSGLRLNMVPGNAHAVLVAKNLEAASKIEVKFLDFLESHPVTGTVKREGQTLTFEVTGKASHGASPQTGINAGTTLCRFLNQLCIDGGAKTFVRIGDLIHTDFFGKALGVEADKGKMGNLTMNAGILHFHNDREDNIITLNFRYPEGVTSDEIYEGVTNTLGKEVTLTKGHDETPHYVPADDPLVETLLEVYKEHTGNPGFEQVIGGGTFGRLLKRGVAFGAQFPGAVDTMHKANEFMEIDDLLKATAIYADAIYRLAK